MTCLAQKAMQQRGDALGASCLHEGVIIVHSDDRDTVEE